MSSLNEVVHICLIVVYVVSMVILTVYGVHRYVQIFLYYRHNKKIPKPAGTFETLPFVTVQLPMYNEMYVAERIIETAAKLEYPRDKFQIQVLDDSTDGSAEIARATCERLARTGVDIEYIHRTNRQGYKAGALANGLKTAKGEFITIFDADFVPNPDMLMKSIQYFTDPNVGCVQTRWDHINRGQSLLTRCQAIFLDGHFMVEHIARNRSGRFMNFNGTAGTWRKSAIDDSGGWQHDTLTEDMDLSYRAQVRGWNFVFLPELLSPAELPPDIVAFKAQQHRWTKGQVQTARKLLPMILKSPLPFRVKFEAFMHLTNVAVYIPAVILAVILFPTWAMSPDLYHTHNTVLWALIVSSFCGILTASAGSFYVLSQKAAGRSSFMTMLMVPLLMAIALGISITNGLAVLEGLFAGKKESEFVRTPKYGAAANNSEWKSRAMAFKKKKADFSPWIELVLGIYIAITLCVAVYYHSASGTWPFLAIFSFGFLYFAFLTFQVRRLTNRAKFGDVPALEANPVAA
jgi:cellulose synthase/poly-beta-1,6-N-acetylglucosamine synthase-like glycosyltransferase